MIKEKSMQGFFYNKSKTISSIKILNCETCGLYKNCISPRMEPSGKGEKGILVIAESPGKTEDEQGTQLVGQTGQVLRQTLRLAGIDLDKDCRKVNALRCRPPENRKPKPMELNCCRQYLWKEIKKFKPKLIIVLGSEAAKSFLGHRWKKDFPRISALRGWPVPDRDSGCWVYYTFHPSFVLRSEGLPTVKKTFQTDIGKAIKLLEKDCPTFKDEKDMIDIVKTKEDIRQWLLLIMDKPPELLSIDYETSGLKPYRKGHFIHTCALSFWNESLGFDQTIAFPMLPEIIPDFKARILNNPEISKVAHFVPHEEAWGRMILKTRTRKWIWDTCLAAHVLDSRRGTAGLKFQTYVNFGLPDYSSHIESFLESMEDKDGNSFNRVDKVPLNNLLFYNGIDALNTSRLVEIQQNKMTDFTYQGHLLLHKGMLALNDVENQGMRTNVSYCEKEERILSREITSLEKATENDKTIMKWKQEKGKKFNLNSAVQLRKVLYDDLKLKPKKLTNKKLPSTDKEALATHIKKVPFLENMQEAKKKITARNFLRGWMREAVDDILHPQFSLVAAETFRSGCSHPNLQNIPIRDEEMQKLLRSAIRPSSGRQLLEADFKGIEVSISACYHKDPVMIAYIKDKSKDMHRDMAMEIFKLKETDIAKEIRYVAKNGFVFPEFYGSYFEQVAPAIWDTVKERELRLTDGTLLMNHLQENKLNTLQQFTNHIQDVENDFWRRFRVYAKWKKNRIEEYLNKGYLELLSGFRCSGPLSRNQITNFPIQGTAFHCLLWTLIRLNRKIKREGWKSRICSQVHDSIIIDLVPTERNVIIKAIQHIINKELPEHWPWIIVPMEVEMELSPVDGSWYMKKEIKT